MKNIRVSVWLVVSLVVFSLVLYMVQLAVFRAPGQTLFYFMQDMAFLPLQVAIVTIALKGMFAAREALAGLPETDLNHLSVDIRRAFSTLLVEWVNYMFHLKTNYPYLFSMAVRMNPFGDKMDAILR